MRRILAALLVAGTAAVAAPARPAHAADGLDVTSTTTYTVEPEAGLVRVVVDATLRNTIAPRTVDGFVTSYYFDKFTWPMPAGASNIVATTSNGSELGVIKVAVPGVEPYFLADIYFRSRLEYGETTQVHLEFDLHGLPPRSAGYNRVNAAYTGFDAYGAGDAGRMTVRFVFPQGWDAEVIGGEVEQSTEGSSTTYTVTEFLDEQYGFSMFVSARRDDALVASTVTLGTGAAGTTIELRAWPGDDGWTAFVADQIDRGLPTLAALIGLAWPEDDGFVIRQAYTPYLYGYAGWYSAADNEIEVGEDLDAETVLHELSHAWFNDGWFDDRWISEGLAQEYSNRALDELGEESFDPEEVSTDDPWAISLEEWGEPDFVDGADGYEAFGYAASYYVVDTLVDEVGDEAMRRIFAAADGDLISYAGDGPLETVSSLRDWRRFLDLVELVGGSTSAEDLFSVWVLTDDQVAELGARRTARADYEALDDRGNAWAPPLAVRLSMSNWEWVDVDERIAAATDALEHREALNDAIVPLDLRLPDGLELAYESAATTAAIGTVANDLVVATAAAEAIGSAAVAAADERGPIAWVGLIGTDVDAALEDARLAFESGDSGTASATAADVIAEIDAATGRGLQRIAIVLVVATAALALITILRRRSAARGRHADSTPSVADRPLPSPAVDGRSMIDRPPAAQAAASSEFSDTDDTAS